MSAHEEKRAEPVVSAPSVSDSGEVWNKILDLAKNVMAPGIIPLLRSVQANMSDNTLYLGVENPLITDMLKERQYMEPLRECANKVLGFNVIIKTQKPQEKKEDNSKLDELCDSLKGLPNITII